METEFTELLHVKTTMAVSYKVKCKHNVGIETINSVVKSIQSIIIFALQISAHYNSSNHGM